MTSVGKLSIYRSP